MQDSRYGLPRTPLLGTRLNKSPPGVPKPAGWHHAHGLKSSVVAGCAYDAPDLPSCRVWIGPPRFARRFSLADRKSTRLNSSHANISYAVFCLKKKNITELL